VTKWQEQENIETGKTLNPTLATLHKGAEALGPKRDIDLSSP
jgi:hypothetical protein